MYVYSQNVKVVKLCFIKAKCNPIQQIPSYEIGVFIYTDSLQLWFHGTNANQVRICTGSGFWTNHKLNAFAASHGTWFVHGYCQH